MIQNEKKPRVVVDNSIKTSREIQAIVEKIRPDMPELCIELVDSIFVKSFTKELDYHAFENCLRLLHENNSIDPESLDEIINAVEEGPFISLRALAEHDYDKAKSIVAGYIGIGIVAVSIESEREKSHAGNVSVGNTDEDWCADIILPSTK